MIQFIITFIGIHLSSFLRSQESPSDKLRTLILQRQQENLKNLELCAKLYAWEEKAGLPHPHTLIEISQMCDVRYQDVLELYSRMSEELELEKTRRILEETARKL
jgi:hypothetical protein